MQHHVNARADGTGKAIRWGWQAVCSLLLLLWSVNSWSTSLWTPASAGAPTLGVWFDAADGSTLTLDPSNSAHVIGWHDKSGNSRDATADASYAPSKTTLNGLTALDFGPFSFSTANPHMFYPEVQVQTVFKVWGSAQGGAFLMTNRYNYSWHRDTPTPTETDPSSAIFETAHSYSEPGVRTGDAITRLNGSVVDPTTTGLSGGWDIVDNRAATGNTYPSDTLALDRTYRSGGQGIAEVIVLSSRPSEYDVQRIEGYLAWKWGLQGKLPSGHPYKTHPPLEPNGSATYIKTDTSTQGYWSGNYGADGYNVINDTVSYPPYADVSMSGGGYYTWQASVPGYVAKALQSPSNSGSGVAACWYTTGSSMSMAVNLTDSLPHSLAIYMMDWDHGSRTQTIEIRDAASNALLDTRNFSGFDNGTWGVWNIAGNVVVNVITTGGTNAVVSGVFFGPPIAGSGTASFVKFDGSTQGTWKGNYGSDGYEVIDNAVNYPAYVTVTATPYEEFTWNASTGDNNALQKAGAATDRIASSWDSFTSFPIRFNVNDGQPHQVAIYATDYDHNYNRTQTYEMRDTATNTLLDSRSIANFIPGIWTVWTITGDVTLTVKNTGSWNAVISGVFFDPPPAPPATLIGEFHFDEASWTGATGELIDTGGGGHNGQAGGSSLPIAASGGPAISGSPGTCGYAQFHQGSFEVPGLPVSTTNGAKTSLSFWVWWDGGTAQMPVGFDTYYLLYSGGYFGPSTGGDINAVQLNGTQLAWHHIAVVFVNGDVTATTVYVDGVKQTLGYIGTANPSWAVVNSTLHVGGFVNGSYRSGTYLDELRVYNGAITQAQVAADMAAGHVCAIPPLPGGFNAFESATGAGAVIGVIHTKVSGSAFAIDVVALDNPRTSVFSSFTGPVKVEVMDASDNSGTLGTDGCRTSWVAVASGASTVASFIGGDAGRKGFTLTEPEAWRNARLRITTPDTGTPLVQACSTDAFAIRPASLNGLSVSDATSATAGTARALVNTAVSGGVVHRAGQPITVQATAINGAGSTTANYAGTPSVALSTCGGAACTAVWSKIGDEGASFYLSTPTTIRFGKGSFWHYATLGVGLYSCASFQFGGDPIVGVYKECDASTLGTLSLTPTATSGVISTVGSYSEVGAFTLQLVDSSFASVDASDGSSASEMNIVSSALDVGRFVPDHFDLQAMASPILKTFDNASCGARSFTYVGQPFGYTSVAQAQVLARNAAGATTQGYAGSLWKLASGGLSQTFGAVPATPALDASGATLPALTSNGDGTGLLVGAGADKLAFTRSGASPIAPFNAAIALTWSAQDASESGVAGNGTIGTTTPLVFSNIGFDAGSQMRFGQIRMVPAYGSELIDLPVLIEAQYWDGQRMATNAADQCTALPMNAVAMGNYQRNLAACKTALGTSPLTLASGRGYIKLKKPGQGNSGSVDLGLQLAGSPTGQSCAAVAGSPAATAAAGLPWLQGRWGNAANYDQNPSTRASFGQYRSPLIYQRESF